MRSWRYNLCALRLARYMTIDHFSTTSLESEECYLTTRISVTLQTCLSITRDFFRLHSTFERLHNAAASPASRLRSAGSLAMQWRLFPKISEHFTKISEDSQKIIRRPDNRFRTELVMPHKHCVRLFRLMTGIWRGPSYKPGGFLGSPHHNYCYSNIHPSFLTYKRLYSYYWLSCNIIVWQINIPSFIQKLWIPLSRFPQLSRVIWQFSDTL